MEGGGSAHKRIKTSCSFHRTTLDKLPGSILSSVASYLAVPSRAFLAVVLTAPSSSPLSRSNNTDQRRPVVLSAASQSVLLSTSHWEVLNFADVEDYLATRMKDDDLRAVLVCIDAVSQLKRLKLVHCNNIEGNGLEPLSGSVILEQMDLSLLEQADEHHRHSLSLDAVVPILESIVDKEGNALRHFAFPEKRAHASRLQNSERYEHFLRRYLRLLRGSRCSKCNDLCSASVEDENSLSSWFALGQGNRWIYQRNTCSKCIKYYCWKPSCRVEICMRCGLHHCKECTSLCENCGDNNKCTAKCDDAITCGRKLCADCVRTCQQCERRGCDDCLNFHRCPECNNKGYCGDCYEGESVDGDQIYCEECGHVQKSDY